MTLQTIRRIVILGANGSFGTLLSRILAKEGASVGGIDLQSAPATAGACTDYVTCDATTLTPTARASIQAADCIAVCLHEQEALQAFPAVAAAAAPRALIFDILSVKTPIVKLMTESRQDVEFLSLHPMFAPTLGFKDQNVVVIEVRPGPRSFEIRAALEDWGAKVRTLTAAKHDALTAATQAATHAAVLAFGMTLGKMDYDLEEALAISTPIHRVLLALLARITSADPTVYWKIQRSNPQAASARAKLAESSRQFQALLAIDDAEVFSSLLQSLRMQLGPRHEALTRYCAAICAVPRAD